MRVHLVLFLALLTATCGKAPAQGASSRTADAAATDW